MKDDDIKYQSDWVGPKRGGRYRHVKPNGKVVDNLEWWYCPRCFNALTRLTATVTRPLEIKCHQPHYLEGGACLDYVYPTMRRLPRSIDLVVFEAAWRIMGPDGIKPLIEAAQGTGYEQDPARGSLEEAAEQGDPPGPHAAAGGAGPDPGE